MGPKDTFNKIAPEKKDRLLKAAAVLFAQNGLSQTDMAQLAARAQVAKGSLYNYFASKEDLYEYVCADGIERSRAAVYGGLDQDWDIYRQIEHIFTRGLAFTKAHPEYVALYLNMSSAGMDAFAAKLTKKVEHHTAAHLKEQLRRGIKAGSVRADLDVNLTALLINGIYIMFLASVTSRHFQIRLREYLEIKGRLSAKALDDYTVRTIGQIHTLLRPIAKN